MPQRPRGPGGRVGRHPSADEEIAAQLPRGGVASRTDFLLKREQIIVETKITRRGLGQRRVAEELATDKELYRAYPDCRTLICFVYDPGHLLANPMALETGLSDPDGPLPTVVVVAPIT